MSIARGVLPQSLESEAHDKVLDNNPDLIGIWKCWFLRRGDENYQQTHMTPSQGIEPGPHGSGASALITAPSLLPTRSSFKIV